MNKAIFTDNGDKTVEKVSRKIRTHRQLKVIRDTIEGLVCTATKRECAEKLKCSEANLYKRLSTYPEIMDGVNRFVDSVKNDARRKLQLTSPVAVDKVIHLLDANSENVQLEASKQILDRSGIVAPSAGTNIQVNVLNKLTKDKDDYDI